MKQNFFNIGQHLIFNQLYCQVTDIQIENIFIQNISNLQQFTIKQSDVDHLINNQVLIVIQNDESNTSPHPLLIATEKQSSIILKRYEYIQAAQKISPKPQKTGLTEIIEKVSKQINDDSPPSISTVYRWWRRWLNTNQELKSLENKTAGKKGYRAYATSINAIFYEVVNEVYLTRERQSKQEVYFSLITKIKQHNHMYHKQIKLPSRATVYRMLGDLDPYTVTAERYGIKEAEKIYRIAGKGISTTYPLERAEIDHTPLDVMVIDDKTGLTIGRPILTCILDSHTRIPSALSIGFEPPSELSVIRALKQAIWPKNNLLKEFNSIQNIWPTHGIPSLLVCDNGLEFHSEHLRRVCAELNIELMFCPKHQPYYKGNVERFLGTANRQVSQRIQGTTFSNIRERGDYDSVQEAVISLSELQEILYLWAIDIYMQTTHSSLNMSPSQKWHQDIQRIEPRLPNNQDQFNLICAKEYQRHINHEGINFKRLKYNSELLRTMRIMYGTNTKVSFRVDPENLEKIWVYDPNTDSYSEVLCTDTNYAKGLTLLQQTMVLKELTIQKKALEEVNIVNLETARHSLNEKIKQLKADKRIKKRTKVARIGKIPEQSLPFTQPQVHVKHVENFTIKNIPNFLVFSHTDDNEEE